MQKIVGGDLALRTQFDNAEYKKNIRHSFVKTIAYRLLLSFLFGRRSGLSTESISRIGFGVFLTNIIFQRILRVNSLTPFMVHYTSKLFCLREFLYGWTQRIQPLWRV